MQQYVLARIAYDEEKRREEVSEMTQKKIVPVVSMNKANWLNVCKGRRMRLAVSFRSKT
ncbi:hypothetical protein Lpp77_00825 [Lacticaseibacillus paracasei subsp. paracasei CNCM I-4270]|uniref:Uncharacterized protein n=1 Tax=Lacticaseibacillus paracasei subsp. paracasei CNCM I-4270 TaxID=1256202 RepID=A0A8E0MC45_LACPA|nr:hypothetical protein Lpp77_00825 [Lacticaseibacillus paracasei subsp. paracasei CNCM I-4270]